MDLFRIAENEANKIMHIALSIGKNLLMGKDVPEHMGITNENENKSKISISTESKEEADKLFNGLSEGGKFKCLLPTVLGVHILVCSGTNMELNGW